MSSREIREKFGCPDSYVRTVARELGVKHTEETKKRLLAYRQSLISHPSRSDEQIDKMRYRQLQMYKMEKWRALNGLPRKTKWRINLAPKKTRLIMNFLCCKRGYFRDCSYDSMALYYDEETRRFSPTYRRQESYYAEQYGIKFVPCEEYSDNERNDNNIECVENDESED